MDNSLLIKFTNIKAARLIGALLILLSGDAFAVTYATQPALDAEKAARIAGDSKETARATGVEGTLKAADTAEVTNRNKAIAAETARAKAAEGPVLIPGDSYQGGIVFWVDVTGQHGLIVAKTDQSTSIRWYNGTYFVTNATADGIYAGAKNTEEIISTQTAVGLACNDAATPAYCEANQSTTPAATGKYAALVAANYKIQDNGLTLCSLDPPKTEKCYGDWYLPSKVELHLLFQSAVLGAWASGYWSSTEATIGEAWLHGNGSKGIRISIDKNAMSGVRAVRAF